MPAPTDAHRQFAADARAMFTALTDVGFTPDQATALLFQLITPPTPGDPRPGRQQRSAAVARLLDQKKPPERSPVDDRSAGLWNPPAPDQGAPARD